MIYNLKGKDSDRIKFNRKLFRYNVQSHNGRYKKLTKGILEKYEKPIRSVVIFERKYLNKVRRLVDSIIADYSLYEIKEKIK